MRYPAYPLITIDPYVSLWSCSDLLNDDDTRLWHGMAKPIYGVMHIDGEHLRFMGAGAPGRGVPQRCLPQKSVEFEPLFTRYIFENAHVRLTLEFWSPAILDDVTLMSAPCSFIDYEVEALDGRAHDIALELRVDGAMCGHGGEIVGATRECAGYALAQFGKREQRPLSERGDGVDINWGEFYLAGEAARYSERGTAYDYDFARFGEPESAREYECRELVSTHRLAGFAGRARMHDVFAYDDGLSLIVLGDALKGVWTERFGDIARAVDYFYTRHDELRQRALEWQHRLIEDARPFGEDYVRLITAVYRQVLAAHKAVRRPDGELLYMSKECNSNGCINTVDVSYPSMPLLLCYNPELVRGLMTGIFEFAGLPCWQCDYAPHDLGQYPIANGQVYALRDELLKREPYAWLELFRRDSEVYDFDYQMPVEECGNMLLMAYAYWRADGTQRARDYIDRYMPLLRRWAQYLIDKGVQLDTQLCTDDFAGHLGKNVNLAIKSCEALCAMGELTGEARYGEAARRGARELTELARNAHGMMLCLDQPDSWSLKYNMVWDTVAGFGLFDAEVRRLEVECYRAQSNEYGVPLDSRKDFTKSDWMLWASALDDSDATTRRMSAQLCAFLDATRDRIPMTDWFDTVTAHRCWMWHRSVQGGLWMPVLKARWNAARGGEA